MWKQCLSSARISVIVHIVVAACVAVRIVVMIVIMVVIASTTTVVIVVFRTVQRRVCFTKATARMRFCGRREQVQRERNGVKVFTRVGVIVVVWCFELFRDTSAQRLYQHIYSAVQFYDGE